MLCWADKLGVLWALLAYVGLFVIANDKSALLAWYFTFEGLKFLLIIVLFPWLILRILDWVAGGPRRRKGVITVRPTGRY